MEKRGELGFMPKKIVSIIVALFFISLAIYLGVLIFNTFSEDNAEQQAEGSLEQVFAVINSLEDRDAADFFVLLPEKWVLISTLKNKKNPAVEEPIGCWGISCVCICESEKNCKMDLCKKVDKDVYFNTQGKQLTLDIPTGDLTISNYDSESLMVRKK